MMEQEEFPKVGYDYQLTLTPILEHAAKIRPKGEIVYKDVFRENYAQFYERCQRLSNALEGLGVKQGSKVITFEWNTHRFLEIYFAVPCMGAVMHMGNPALAPAQIAYIINHAEDEVLLFNKEFTPLIEALSDKLKTVKHYVVLTDDGKLPETKLKPISEYEELLKAASPKYEYPELNENTIATLGYTTGTMGDPKGCFYTHRQLVLHTLNWANFFQGFLGERGMDPRRDLILHLVPMFHAHSWGIPYIATYLCCKQVYPGRFDPKVFLELMKKEKKPEQHGFSASVATMLNAVCYHPEVEQYKQYLKGLTYIIGGTALPKGLALRAKELGMESLNGWGMSETCPIVAVSYLKPHMLDWPEDKKLDFLLRTGIAFPFVDQRVADEEGKDVPKDAKTFGEIVLRAPWVISGYYKDPERSKEAWRGGWFHTGDIANIDEEENVRIVDRDKDVIKSGGEWISTLILEDLISLHPKVAEATVIAAKHEKWEERPIALVVPKEGYKGEISEEELREHLTKFCEEGKILKWWIPEKFIFIDSIAKTSVGKFDKKMLRPQYWEMLKEG